MKKIIEFMNHGSMGQCGLTWFTAPRLPRERHPLSDDNAVIDIAS